MRNSVIDTPKKRVLLILPPNVNVIEPFCSAENKQPPLLIGFPLGLGYIASYLLQKGKYEVKIVDANRQELTIEDTIEIIEHFDPHYIGLTIYTINSKVAVRLAREIKLRFKDKIVIAGGPHVSCSYDNFILKYPYFDFLVIGEGEVTMSELLDVLDSKDSYRLKEVKGIAYVDQYTKNLMVTSERPLDKDIDQFPFPARWLLNFNSYISKSNLLPYSVEIMGSRGCSHRCVFCSFQKAWRARKIEEIIKEIKDSAIRYPQIKSFLFFDDNFSFDKKRVIELCRALIRDGLNKYMWSCLCRVDQVTEEMLLWMKRAGCTKIMFGIETADPGILKNINKKITPQDAQYAIELSARAGIDTLAFFIIGNPGETIESIKASYNFAKKLKCHSTVWSIMQVYPGTALARMQPCEDFVTYLYKPEVANPSDLISANVPVFENPGLDREALKLIHKKVFRKIVFYKAFRHPLFTLKKLLMAPKAAFRFLFVLLKHEKINTLKE